MLMKALMRRLPMSWFIAVSFMVLFWAALVCSGVMVYVFLGHVMWAESVRNLSNVFMMNYPDDAELARFVEGKPLCSPVRNNEPAADSEDKGRLGARQEPCHYTSRTFTQTSVALNNGAKDNFRELAELMNRGCSYARIYDKNGQLAAASVDSDMLRFNNAFAAPIHPTEEMFAVIRDNWETFGRSRPVVHRDLMAARHERYMHQFSRAASKVGFVCRNVPFQYIRYISILFMADGGREMPPPPPRVNLAPLSAFYVDYPEHMVMVSPMIYKGDIIGYTEISIPWGFAAHTLRLASRTIPVICALFGIAIAVFAFFIAKTITSPMQVVVNALSGLESGDLRVRANLGEGRNEVFSVGRAVDHMADSLQNAFSEQQRFIGDASHELKTPLTSLMGSMHVLKLMLSDVDLDPKAVKKIESIDKELSRMEKLIMDLLTLSRNSELLHRRPSDPVCINDVVEEAVEVSLSSSLQHPVNVEKMQSMVCILGDEAALVHALRNVLDNALRHTPADKEVKVSVKSDADTVTIFVSDQGCGIAPEHLPNLTKRFYRSDAGRDRLNGGTGLGLAITEAVISRHGGTLKFESEIGKGTVVSITLPVQKMEPEA